MPQAAFAVETGGTTTVPNGKFSDTSTHWANKHITKIALLGFAQGNAGEFAPSDSISHQEAIIMLINMMGKKDQINLETEAILPFEVAAWAKPYVDLALGEKLINMQEELGTVTEDWGATSASREWITKLIVRALGQEEQAVLASDDETGFTDSDLIGDGYAGYINIAQSLNIVKGSDGKFNPTGLITRAEMAVILGQAEQHLTVRSSMISTGIVLSSDGVSIQIQESSGIVETLSLHHDAVLYIEGSNSPIQASGISVDDYVTVIHDQGVAYYVEISDQQVVMQSFTGTMESISLVDLTVSVNIDGESQSFRYVDDVVVMSNSGNGLSLSSLTVGSTLELKRIRDSASTDITQIIVKAAPVFKTVIGTVANIQTVNRIVEMTETSTGTTVAYNIPASIEITNGTRTLTSLKELYIGDEVTVDLKDDVITSFVVTKSSIIVEEGIVESVDVEGEKIFFLTPEGKIDGYFIGEGVQVLISGLNAAGIVDIQKNDEVIIELNGNFLVTKITVKNRTIETKLGLEFFSYDADAKVVYLKKDKTSIAEAYEINESTILEASNTTVTLANLGTYFTKGKKVDITYSGNRIMVMKLSTNYDGKLVEINTITKTIKINSDYYGAMSINYTNVPTVEIFGKTNAALSDLDIGDQIQVVLDSNQVNAIQIKLLRTQIFKVTTKTAYKLTVTGETLTALDIYNSISVPITHHSKSIATYADITENMYIEVTMAGLTAKSIYIPEVTIGELTAVNTTSGSLTINEYGGVAKTISSITSVRVNKNSIITSTLASIAVNDRVLVVEGTNGIHWITVITPVKKKFLAYTASTKTVQLSVTLLTDQNKFVLADYAYIHKGTQVLTATSLVRNDDVMVYILNGKIAEIEKL